MLCPVFFVGMMLAAGRVTNCLRRHLEDTIDVQVSVHVNPACFSIVLYEAGTFASHGFEYRYGEGIESSHM